MNAIILDNKKGNASESSKSFGGVRYNTNKMETGKGELMALRNFGEIQNDSLVRPEDVKAYLLSVSKLNPKKEKVQFHATITARGREYDKHQLTEAAHEWIKRMGYGNNPYIIVFHSDTKNNHVHIVSSRVNAQTGKSISDSLENVRAVKFINQIVKEKYGVDKKLQKEDFLKYNVTTLAQLKLLYEVTGHTLSEVDGKLNVFRSDQHVHSYCLTDLISKIESNKEDDQRKRQLKAIFSKYLPDYGAALLPVHQKLSGGRDGKTIGYKSDFTEFLRERFGLQFVFHFKDDKPPYGYTIIDHKTKSVFKGGGIMKLPELTKSPDHKVRLTYLEKQLLNLKDYNIESLSHVKILARKFKVPAYQIPMSDRKISTAEISYYKDLLTLYLRKNDISTISNIDMEMIKDDGKWYVLDNGAKTILDAEEVLSPEEIQSLDHEHDINEQISFADIGALNPLGGLANIAAGINPEKEQDPSKRKKKKKR